MKPALLPVDAQWCWEQNVICGRSLEDIGKEAGCSYGTIANRIRSLGLQPKKCSVKGPRRSNSLCGFRTGKLTVVKDVGTKCRLRQWLCLCDCGVEVVYSSDVIKRKRRISCGECRVTWSGQLSSTVWSRMTLSIQERGVPLLLTRDEASQLFDKAEGRCSLSGLPIVLGLHLRDSTASLDRIDSSLSYSVDNCQWVERRVNYMKKWFSVSRFIELCELVTNPLDASNYPIPLPPTSVHRNWAGHGGISGTVWTEVTKTPHEFLLTIEEAWRLFVAQRGACAMTGQSLFLPTTTAELRSRVASLDRIDSRLGYQHGNVQWVHPDVNFLKDAYTMDEARFICKAVADRAKKEA